MEVVAAKEDLPGGGAPVDTSAEQAAEAKDATGIEKIRADLQALDKAQSGTLNDKTRALRTLIPDMTRTFLEASKIPDVDQGSAMFTKTTTCD